MPEYEYRFRVSSTSPWVPWAKMPPRQESAIASLLDPYPGAVLRRTLPDGVAGEWRRALDGHPPKE